MILWRAGRVVAVAREWAGAVELDVELDDGPDDGPGDRPDHADRSGRRCRALAYPALTGRPAPGDRVLLNATALQLGLGTGGYALVVAVPDRLPADPVPGPGHLVKGRYGPLQTVVLGVDEQHSEHHDLLREADDLAGMPVVVADLHSSLPAVLAGLLADRPGTRVAYLMTDGGALPAWFSRTVAGLREAGWLQACVTAGQAFGGDLEAVTVHTALLAARLVLDAEAVVVTQGPGNLGTGTRWGFSGVAAGEAVNAAGVLGGRPVAVLRVSGADLRPRHRGVSHHSLTAYGRVALHPADVVLPRLTGDLAGLGSVVAAQAAALVAPAGRHRGVEVDLDGLAEALAGCPVPLSTMGRGPADDPAAFLAAAAAGRHVAALLS